MRIRAKFDTMWAKQPSTTPSPQTAFLQNRSNKTLLRWEVRTLTVATASTAPAAPSKCPMRDFVEFIFSCKNKSALRHGSCGYTLVSNSISDG